MKWGTKIKYTAFIVLCSLAFAVSGISGVFSSFKTEGTSGFSIYYTAPKPVNLQAIQFYNSYSTATSITFDYYNDEYNEIIASATTSKAVDENGDGSIMLYKVGSALYVLSDGQIYANATCNRMFSNMTSLTSIQFNNFNTSKVTIMAYMFAGDYGSSTMKLTSLDLSSFDTTNVTSMSHMFYLCSGLTRLDLSSFNTINVTNMGYMFYNCSVLTSLDLSSFNTSKVTDMRNMFNGCSGLSSLNVSSFNTSNVTDMAYMFYWCTGLTSLDLSVFDTSKVTDMDYMFYRCRGLTTIYVSDTWTTSAVTSSDSMFYECTSLVGGDGTSLISTYKDKTFADVTGYLTHINSKLFKTYASSATVITFDYYSSQYDEIIANADATYEVEDYNIGKCTVYIKGTEVYILSNNTITPKSGSCMFYNLRSLTTINFNNFDTTNVTNMSYMFEYCWGLTSLDLSVFDTSKVTDMSGMFYYCSGLTSLDLSVFDTGKVTNMKYMFYGCSGLTSLDLTPLDTSNVTTMYYMFYSCRGLTTIYVSDTWTISSERSNSYVFSGCTSLVGGTGTKYIGNLEDWNYATVSGYLTHINSKLFKTYASNATSITFDYYSSQYDEIIANADATYEVEDYNIGKCTVYIKGTEVYILSNNTITPKSGRCMLYGLRSLTTINFNNFNTSNVSNMQSMFDSCSGLTSLDLSSFNTSKVTNMAYMFYYCSELTSLNLSGWNTSNVTNMSYMFYYCSGLISLDLSSFDTSKVTTMSSMFYQCYGLTSLNLSDWDTSKVTDMYDMFFYCSELTTIYVSSSWSTTNVTSSYDMFYGCTKLVGGNGTKYNSSSYKDKTYARIDTASTPGYLTKK